MILQATTAAKTHLRNSSKRALPGKFALLSLSFAVSSLVSMGASAQLPPSTKDVEGAFPAQKHYSPYAGRHFPTEVLWGDTHLHTGNSLDAGAFGARLLPGDAHRFARGEELTSSTGLKVKLSRPLDFLVVSDHSDNMGFSRFCNPATPKCLPIRRGKSGTT